MTDEELKEMKHAFMLQHQLLIKLEEKLRVRGLHQELYNKIMEENKTERLSLSNQQ